MPASTKKDAKAASPAKPDAAATQQQIEDIPVPVQIEMLRQMLRIRRLEERSGQLYQQQKIGGFCHLYVGQEAVAAGTMAAIRPDDYVMTTYRDHGLALARGISSEAIFAE